MIENIALPCTKEKLDKALLSFEKGASICWNCIETHYPDEFAKRNGYFGYRRWCDACGTKQACTWTSIWRVLIFTSKEDIWLINQFEKDTKRLSIRGLELSGSDACFELVKRGNKILPTIFNYFDSNQGKINKEGWSYFFLSFARHHNLVKIDSNTPKDFKGWMEIFSKIQI